MPTSDEAEERAEAFSGCLQWLGGALFWFALGALVSAWTTWHVMG